MAGDFKTIITHFNKLDVSNIFTSTEMKAALVGAIKTPGNVSSFLATAYKMGVIEKDPIENRIGRGPRFIFMKTRSITKSELHKLTTRPDCFTFKKEIEKRFMKSIKGVTSPRKKIHKKTKTPRRTMPIKSHYRTKPSRKTVSITEHPDKTTITIYK